VGVNLTISQTQYLLVLLFMVNNNYLFFIALTELSNFALMLLLFIFCQTSKNLKVKKKGVAILNRIFERNIFERSNAPKHFEVK
jgi:hypothetical protein